MYDLWLNMTVIVINTRVCTKMPNMIHGRIVCNVEKVRSVVIYDLWSVVKRLFTDVFCVVDF
jgi:hypothetical protein